MKNIARLLPLLFLLACQNISAVTPAGSERPLLKSRSQDLLKRLNGKIQWPESLKTQSALASLTQHTAVSLIYPPDSPDAGALLSSGLSDAQGQFTLEIDPDNPPETGDIFVLEAHRRLTQSQSESLALQTLVRWDGTGWSSISSPDLIINAQTTALALAASLDPAITPTDTLGSLQIQENNPQMPALLGSHSAETLNILATQVETLVQLNQDPVAAIALQEGLFRIKEPDNPQLAWLQQNPCPDCTLHNVDFTGRDFSGLNFSGRNWQGSRLMQSNFTASNLSQANLSQSWLQNSNLTQANLSQANLQQARLQGANLAQTHLHNADLSQADLRGVDLRTSQLAYTNFAAANLQSANFSGLDLRNILFTGATLSHAMFHQSNLSGLDLRQLDLRQAGLTQANLQNTQWDQARLNDARLQQADLSGAHLGTVDLNGARLDGATWVNGQSCESGSRSLCSYELRVNQTTTGDQTYARVSTAPDGRSVVVWNDGIDPHIQVQPYDHHGLPLGVPRSVNTSAASAFASPDVAMAADGRFAVVWDYSSDGEGSGIFARLYDAEGNALSEPVAVNTYTTGDQRTPRVAFSPDGNTFIAVWTNPSAVTGQDESGGGIYQRRFSGADATALDAGEVLVNAGQTTGVQTMPAIACNNQYAVIVYTDQNTAADGSGHSVFGRVYRLQDNLAANLFRVNTSTTRNQTAPAVAMRDNGTFAVAWHSNHVSSANNEVYTRRFGLRNPPQADLAYELSSEVRVNTHTAFSQEYPVISMNPAGYYVIAWESASQDGSPYSVYAQKYNPFGQVVGTEFRLNTVNTGFQWYPAIALAQSRRITAVWSSNQADGAGMGVIAKQMEY